MKTPVTLLIEKVSEIEFYTEPYKSLIGNLLEYAEQLKDLEKQVINNAFYHGKFGMFKENEKDYYESNFHYDTKSTQGSRISRTKSREDWSDV